MISLISMQRRLIAALFSFALLALSARVASAQQITYYNFDTPASASPTQYSYSCSTTASPANPLFCFNAQGSYTDPVFIQDPAATGPYAAQMTYPQPSQASSMWFSVPQKVAGGFTDWFQFKITPAAGFTADGFAFVLQNAQGPSSSNNNGIDPSGNCTEVGSGPTVVGGAGGCIGYGGIDNSVSLEFDTYANPWDPTDLGPYTYNDNHIALQDCGPGVSNSPEHQPIPTATGTGTANCSVSLGATSTLVSNPASSADGITPVTLADGRVHDVVIVYNGPLDSPANTLSVYIDPTYNPGTHTPVAGSVPVFEGPYDITQALNLINSGSASDSAYVGFTSSTGGNFETHEIMGWTFTPHTTVQQQQPLAPAGATTTFDFGTHSYSVTFPPNAQTSGVGMGVIANTISEPNFASLLGHGPTQYTGSQCQVYDDTGGNCIVYSAYCYDTATNAVEACPAGTQTTVCTDPTQPSAGCITVTSSYNNSGTAVPPSPGYLQGDPLYSPVTSITGNGTSTTVSCTGECAVSPGQTVTILNPNGSPAFPGVTVASATINSFTFVNSWSGTSNGGFVTSNNVQDIFTSYSPASIDGTTAGKTTSYSDFVVTSTTLIGSQTAVTVPSGGVNQNQPAPVTATITTPTNGPTGLPLLSASSAGNTLGGTVSFSDSNGPIASCQNVAVGSVTSGNVTTWQAQCSYTPTGIGQTLLSAQYSGDPYHQSSSGSQTLSVNPQTAAVTVGTSPAGLSFAVNGSPYTAAQTLTWNVGANYSLYASSPQSPAPGTQYVFSSWSNGITSTTSQTDGVLGPAVPTNWTANFITRYALTISAGPGGSVSPATGGYYTAGTLQPIVATPNAGYVFSGWTGSGDVATPGSASTTVTMNKPEALVATFTATPQAGLSVSNLNFGTLYLGSLVTKTVTLSNTGAASLTVKAPLIAIVQGGDSSEFIALNLCPSTLAAGRSCMMTVTFLAGPFYTPQTAVLTINDNAPGAPQTVGLSAQVINPQARLSSGSLSFGTVPVNTSSAAKSATLTNSGATALSITNLAIAGSDPRDFSIVANTCPASLAAGTSCTLAVSFNPTAKGARSGSVVITDNAQSGTQTVALTGTGK